MNEKVTFARAQMLSPTPVVLVGCAHRSLGRNVLTIAWTGVDCSDPPVVHVSIRPSRYSHKIIKESGVFTVNVPTRDLLRQVDLCGVVSGREGDKFARAGLTPAPAEHVRPPIIAECPINIECRVSQTLPLGSHTLFIGEIVGIQVTKRLVSSEHHLSIEKAGLLAFAHGTYFELGKAIGSFGFSVKKK